MPRSKVESYQARVSTVPPMEKSFPADDGPEGGLMRRQDWAEDQVRAFLTEHSLPHDFWHAGTIFAVAMEEGRYEQRRDPAHRPHRGRRVRPRMGRSPLNGGSGYVRAALPSKSPVMVCTARSASARSGTAVSSPYP